MIYRVTINNKVYEVEVEEGKASLLRTEAAPQAVAAAEILEAPTSEAAFNPAAASGGEAEGAFTAPMPGVVIDILTAKGRRVKKGDPIMIIEAMKMENEVSSNQNGTVVEIFVSRGAQVKTGDPLILIK